ncbi:MAG: hypothetical protein M1817_005027 [Caeruleum heppii]|nr:MAG: hypothetical protein M1817_005027 [Caeruleum heppii]
MQSNVLRRASFRSEYVCYACRFALPTCAPAPQRAFHTTANYFLQRRRTKRKAVSPGTLVRLEALRRQKAGASHASNDDQPETPQSEDSMFDPAGEAKSVKARIEKIEAELEEMRGANIFKDPEFLADLTDAERAELEETLKNVTEDWKSSRGHKTADSKDAGRRKSAASVKISAPKEQRAYLDRFNGNLKRAERDRSSPENRKQLWRWYMRCKQNIPAFTLRISPETWDVLWETQSALAISNPDRGAHLRMLGEDIRAAGHEMRVDQKVAYIESLSVAKPAQAIEEWQANSQSLKSSDEGSREFLALGVRLFASSGDPQRAEKVAHILLQDPTQDSLRSLFPLISAWNEQGTLSGFHHAWALYVRVHGGIGPDMTMEDYDFLSNSFLQAGNPDLALAVFRDMMLTGDKLSGYDSSALHKKAHGFVEDVRDISMGASETNKITLEAMTILPRKFQNKFFYGSWVKKLLGAGEVDSAAQVVDLMYQRKVRPDPKYLNGIIGAWIRLGDEESLDKAEKMAWEMIEQRKIFAFNRRQNKRIEHGLSHTRPLLDQDITSTSDSPTPSPAKHIPPATLETFCILIEHYLTRENYDQVRWLNRSIRLAEIQPNAFFMNHLLRYKLHTEGLRSVWEMYTEWAHRSHDAAKPDIETFGFLWTCAKLRTGKNNDPDDPSASGERDPTPASSRTDLRRTTGFPSPRALFADMTSWSASIDPSEKRTAHAEFPKDLHDNLISCFINPDASDLVGVLVALSALRDHFGIYPNAVTARTIVLHLARRDTHAQHLPPSSSSSPLTTRPRHRIPPSKRLDASVKKITARLQSLAETRMHELGARGVDVETADKRFRAEENLFLIVGLLKERIAGRDGSRDVEGLVQRAAWDMGVGGMRVGEDHLSGMEE